MRLAVSLLSFVAAVALIGGCTGGARTSEVPKPEGPAAASPDRGPVVGQLRVALLTTGPVSDAGWAAMAYDALKAVEADFGAQVSNQEAKDAQIRDAMRTYAQEGYHLVIGHGFEYNQPAVEVARDFPKTVFLSTSGSEFSDNAGTVRFYLEQGFYLAGMMAGKMSKTGKVAMIGGPEVPSIKSTFKAFRAGAEAARPGVQVSEVFTGKERDIAAAKQATLSAIDAGADFVIHQANAAAQGVFDAAKERGVFAFGANLDQNDNASGAVIASAVIRAKPVILDVAKRVKDGTYRGQLDLWGMDKGAIEFVVNPALASRVPTDVMTLVQETEAKIKAGDLVVPKDEF